MFSSTLLSLRYLRLGQTSQTSSLRGSGPVASLSVRHYQRLASSYGFVIQGSTARADSAGIEHMPALSQDGIGLPRQAVPRAVFAPQ